MHFKSIAKKKKMVKSNDEVPSNVNFDELPEIVALADFPPSCEVVIPTAGQLPESCPGDCVVFFEYPFTIGFKFPFSPLVRDFLSLVGVAPGQMLPSFWRICWVIGEKTESWEEEFTTADLLSCYDIKRLPGGRMTLRSKPGQKLVNDEGVNDRGWKTRFFYVKKDSLGEVENWLISGWNWKGTENFDLSLLSGFIDTFLLWLLCRFGRGSGRFGFRCCAEVQGSTSS